MSEIIIIEVTEVCHLMSQTHSDIVLMDVPKRSTEPCPENLRRIGLRVRSICDNEDIKELETDKGAAYHRRSLSRGCVEEVREGQLSAVHLMR